MGYKVVSYHGVQLDVPASWPVIEGYHVSICLGPFTTTPTVFVGPGVPGGMPSCAPGPNTQPRDGVWLYAEGLPADSVPVADHPGLSAFQQSGFPVRSYWYHGVSVEVGIGPNPSVATDIVNSIRHKPGARDTPVGDVCVTRTNNLNVVPTPERLDTVTSFDRGVFTLNPVGPNDQPTVTATTMWANVPEPGMFETYRLLLARFGSGPVNSVVTHQVPDYLLVWVIYMTPFDTVHADCGVWGITAFDAGTGQVITREMYSAGP